MGIVKRPYPTATDQRFAVVPRSRADLDLGAVAAAATGSAAPGGGAPGTSPGVGGSGLPVGSGPAAGPGLSGGPDIPLSALADHLGAMVRVGGLVISVDLDGIRLDDGTATVRLAFEDAAADLAALLQPGDAVNVTGSPEARDEVVLVVRDPAGLVLLGDLGGDGDAAASADPLALLGVIEGEDGPIVARSAAVSAALAAGRGPDAPSVALATLLLTGTLAVGLAAYRATRSRRRVRARIQARLDAITAPPEPPRATPA